MKFNLKNRPSIFEESRFKSDRERAEAIDKWFEGFEKELRNRIYPDWQKAEGPLVINLFIKEILGE